MELKLVAFPLLLLLLLFSPHSAAAASDRVPTLSDLPRRLLQHLPPQTPDALARGYMSNSELEGAILDFGRRCSNISRVYSIGKSVKGVPLWVVEISDKAGKEEPEPSFKFIGNVHGDEPVGRELLILLANWLCNNYMKDPLATLIINDMHLHILPTMNPDGFALRRRGNANNVDLNRDFPDQFFPTNDAVGLRQPETRAIMDWVKGQQFTASASLHGGALVANYPWDGSGDSRKKYFACPDDETFQYMASIYSRFHYNMSLSTEFNGGITNGAFWYPIYGGMQDWNYIHGGCLELTLEISDNKWPKSDELPVLFEHNRMSMLNLAATLVKTGIHGRIFSSNNGHPLPASVTVKGIDYRVNASRSFGYYNRILAPGESYKVTVDMLGYRSKTTPILLGDAAVSLDFILEPENGDSVTKSQVGGHDCDCDGVESLELVGILRSTHTEICLAAIVVVFFLYLLFKRKLVMPRFSRHRHPSGHKRAAAV